MENQEATVASVDEGVSSAELSATPDGTPESSEPDSNLPLELRPGKDGKPPEITPQLIRKLRARYFTVRHPVLEKCGHRFDLINEPRNNCEICWINFFAYHRQLVETADQFYRTQGKGPLIAMRGAKFVRYFTRYMSTLYKEQQEDAESKRIQPSMVSGQPGETSGEVEGQVSQETPGN